MTYYFYDLETSGRNPRTARIMQFAGQRTDENLNPIGHPHNILIKLTPDILPEPDAILMHGISPQRAIAEGLTEADFLKIFNSEIAIADTTFVGYNSIRFDDEFMRFALWRNFTDAYEWQWKDGSSRWDMLDVVRMARALRPGGITWPQTDAGNRLEILAELNKLTHVDAHDALSDVAALIQLAKLIKDKQPKLFSYLLNLRDKKKLEPFVKAGEPFVYTSGRYPKENLHTSLAVFLADSPKSSSALVFDLRIDPRPYFEMSADSLAEVWRYKPWQTAEEKPPYFPIKELAYNKCAAVAPASVLDKKTAARIKLDMDIAKVHMNFLKENQEFAKKIQEAWKLVYPERKKQVSSELEVDERLYDGFLSNADRIKMSAARAANPEDLHEFAGKFQDERLNQLLPLYKARNWPESLTDQEQKAWQKFLKRKLTKGGQNSQVAKFTTRLNQVAGYTNLSKEDRYLLEELSGYAQSIAPVAL